MEDDEKTHWYVMRDLKRANASLPAYKLLEKEKIEVFTPMKTILIVKQGRRVRKKSRSFRICFLSMISVAGWIP